MTEERPDRSASTAVNWLDLPIRPLGGDVLAEVFGDEAVVVQLRTGAYYSFDATATALWTAAGRSARVGEIGDDPAAGPDGEQRLLEFVTYLLQEELMELDGTVPDVPISAGVGDGDGAQRTFRGIEKYTDMEDLLVLDPIHDIDLDGDGWPTVHDAGRALE